MKKLFLLFLTFLFLSPSYSYSCEVCGHKYESKIIGNNNKTIGDLLVKGGKEGVVLRITTQKGSLTPGWHGVHFHEMGDCSDHAGFKNSKAHINKGDQPHGLLNKDGHDNGDLPNIYADANGVAKAEIFSPFVNLDKNGLLDKDGSALIIHANEDDHKTQPIGGAGDRIGCSVILKNGNQIVKHKK